MEYDKELTNSCKALWVETENHNLKLTDTNATSGDLTQKNCTTTFNNMRNEHSNEYHFRVDCDNSLKLTFTKTAVKIVVKDSPPSPTLTPSKLEVKEGTSVHLNCSAPAPCLPHPPTLTWSPSLGESVETPKEDWDKTKVKTSVLTFTASKLHHGQKISCSAVYKKQDGSPDVSTSTSLTASVLYGPQNTSLNLNNDHDLSIGPQNTRVSVRPSGPVPERHNVTLTCRSDANPPIKNYSWYRADGHQVTFIGTGRGLTTEAFKLKSPFFCKAENDLVADRSKNTEIDVQFPPQILPSSHCIKTTNQVNCSCETVGNPPPNLIGIWMVSLSMSPTR
ncbi:myelin-associated glycoprotein-like [Menidia menidia]